MAPSSVSDPVPDTYEQLREEITLYHVGNRTLSTALLAWFLEAVWRLDLTLPLIRYVTAGETRASTLFT